MEQQHQQCMHPDTPPPSLPHSLTLVAVLVSVFVAGAVAALVLAAWLPDLSYFLRNHLENRRCWSSDTCSRGVSKCGSSSDSTSDSTSVSDSSGTCSSGTSSSVSDGSSGTCSSGTCSSVSDGSSGTCSSVSDGTCGSGGGGGGGVRKGPVQCVVYDNCQVLPGDIDRNMHMSNDKYLYHLNFARKRFFGQAGVWEYLWRRGDGWNLVVTSQSIRYRKELRLWQRYRVEVRLVGWSDKDKSFYLESCFITGEGESVFVHAVHWVKYRLLGKDNSGNEVAMPSSVLSACSSNEGDGGRADSDNFPVVNGLQNADAEHFRLWNEANAFSSARMRSRTHDSKTSR